LVPCSMVNFWGTLFFKKVSLLFYYIGHVWTLCQKVSNFICRKFL